MSAYPLPLCKGGEACLELGELLSQFFDRAVLGAITHLDVDVVARDDLLAANGADLDLDVDDFERLGADVDLHEARVDGLVELAEAGDEPDSTWGGG